MPFRARFDCLWCGDAWTARGPADLEGWAQLCPTCLGRAGSNAFLRGRLRTALAERAAAAAVPEAADDALQRVEGPSVAEADTDARAEPRDEAEAGALPRGEAEALLDGPAEPPAERPVTVASARVELSAPRAAPILRRPAHPAAAFPDDWFLRRGPFERGPVHDTAWAAELDVVTRWLDAQPLYGRILEPAAGVGFFSPLLAERGELHATDVDGAALDIARSRLVAHRLRAHLHVADPWARPSPDERPFDALVASFLLGRVRGAGADPASASLRARLRPGGRLALIDLRPDPAGGPPPGIAWAYHDLDVVEAALARAGFARIEVSLTGRFFLTASATAV
ncbi:MAG TPA: class I SAM-dependent methyltransferase [Candidatus Limnocylindrales bacterium]